ncbi:MAG: hypothetical protein KME40_22270 [Komarekiella atlantica HA4396-MV6]|jgi:hypothetical protein|nr:hypothetical protein [Komarekiella atlantica HA4396-MV6]
MVIDSYFGDGINQYHRTILEAAKKYPVLPYPICGEPLPRYPIWVEY